MNISEIKFNLLQQKIELLKVLKKIEENKPLRSNFLKLFSVLIVHSTNANSSNKI